VTNIESASYIDSKKNLYIFVFIGARGETRTRTCVSKTDFKSVFMQNYEILCNNKGSLINALVSKLLHRIAAVCNALGTNLGQGITQGQGWPKPCL